MADESEISTQRRTSESGPNVVLIQDSDDSLQGLKPVAPGASSGKNPANRQSAIFGYEDGAENGASISRPQYVMLPDPPSGAPITSSRAFSFETRPYEVSGFSSGYGGNLIQQQLINTQQMCLQQQQAMSALTDTVNKIRQSIEVREKQETSKRKGDADDSRDFRSLLDETVSEGNIISDVSDDGNLSSHDENSSDEEGEPESKRQKVQEQEESSKDESGKGGSNKKLQKLKNLESNFKKEKKYAEKVHEVVASTVNEGIEAIVEHKADTVQNLLKKYDRPENCKFLEVPKVNKAVWTSKQTSKELKESDRLMQRTQNYLTKGLIPLVTLMDKTLKSESEESEELFDLAMDSFNLLAFAHRDISNQRRRLLTPAIDGKYKQMCGESAPISSTHLFGDEENLEKRVREIDESRKIGNKINLYKAQKEKFKGLNQGSKSPGYQASRYNNNKDTYKSSQYSGKTSNYRDNFLSKKAQNQHHNKKSHKKGELGHQKR